jgi:hypothetical protein
MPSDPVVCAICGKEFPDMYDDNGEILKHISTHTMKEIFIVAFWKQMIQLKDE